MEEIKKLTKLTHLLKTHTKQDFEEYKRMVQKGEIDLNKDYLIMTISLYSLLDYIRKCNMLDAEICYQWADFIADQCKTIDYTSVLDKYIDNGAIHPFILAVLLKHGADINAFDEENECSYYKMIAAMRDIDRDFLNDNPDEIAQIAAVQSDCSYRMATHAAQGSVKAVDNLLKESYNKIKTIEEKFEQK